MNKIYIDQEGWEPLEQWQKENAGFVLSADPYFKEVELHYSDSTVVAYAMWQRDHWKINVKSDEGILGTLYIERTKDGNHDFGIQVKEKSNLHDPAFFRRIAGNFLVINAYLTYGNLLQDKHVVLLGRNEGNDKVIVFRAFEGRTYAVSTSTHRSPEGIFSVRGHFRRYKDGKVIWIDEYLKGVEKDGDGKK